LRKYRLHGPDDPISMQGPPFIRISAQLVLYEIGELDRWLNARKSASAAADPGPTLERAAHQAA